MVDKDSTLENTPTEWLRNVVFPTGGDSVASLAAAPVVEQTVEGTEGVNVDASNKHKAEEVKDDVEGESIEKKKEKKKEEAEKVVVFDVDKSEKKKKKKDKENCVLAINLHISR
ncbi:Dyskerin-like protein [Artemisia annua]|uniref:Dyskerin-like protein n=1 Tax=Artemisia annua TaxID=35608 RepID=A0A2U1N3W5_ARTAN|nr:Dyskerin-like protein [Artemisia annua]